VGRHLVADFFGCDADLLNATDEIRSRMLIAGERIGVTVVGEVFHQYAPQGVSGTIVIAESHMSIHTWPEKGYAAVDIFTCGGLDPRPGFEYLTLALKAESMRMQEIIRGINDDVRADQRLLPDDVLILSSLTELQQSTALSGEK
jgi:S-adenosylmethionine decarboxylase proenzyme